MHGIDAHSKYDRVREPKPAVIRRPSILMSNTKRKLESMYVNPREWAATVWICNDRIKLSTSGAFWMLLKRITESLGFPMHVLSSQCLLSLCDSSRKKVLALSFVCLSMFFPLNITERSHCPLLIRVNHVKRIIHTVKRFQKPSLPVVLYIWRIRALALSLMYGHPAHLKSLSSS